MCQTKFVEFENLMCLGCDFIQPIVVNETKKEISVCQQFVKRLYGPDLDAPTTEFDNCGIFYPIDDTTETVIPSLDTRWPNAEAFLNDPVFKPPFFGEYTVVIDKSDDISTCYNWATMTMTSTASLVFIMFTWF